MNTTQKIEALNKEIEALNNQLDMWAAMEEIAGEYGSQTEAERCGLNVQQCEDHLQDLEDTRNRLQAQA